MSEAREIFCLNFEGTSRRSHHEQRANNEKIVIEAVTKRREMYKIMHIEVEPKSRKAPWTPSELRENPLNEQKEIDL